MRKLLPIAFICILASCGPLHHINYKLDVADFKRLQVNDTVHRSLENGIVIVTQVRHPDGSYEEAAIRQSNSIIVRRYFYPSGRFKTMIRTTNGFKFGESVLYDDTGHLVTITDNDAPYKFTMTKMDEKFALGYSLNIFGDNTTVVKSTMDSKLIYVVTFPLDKPGSNKVRKFVVDGITGKTLSDITVDAIQRDKKTPLHS